MTLAGLPPQVATELKRVVDRWHQLPLGHALSGMPSVRLLVQRLADEVAAAEGRAADEVPDLGPGVVMEQLRVAVWDWCQTAPGWGQATPGWGQTTRDAPRADAGEGTHGIPDLAERLARLRRALS